MSATSAFSPRAEPASTMMHSALASAQFAVTYLASACHFLGYKFGVVAFGVLLPRLDCQAALLKTALNRCSASFDRDVLRIRGLYG
jgi:hypothetical protein